MGFVIIREDFVEFRVGGIAIGLAGFFRHLDATIRHEGAL